MSRVTMTYAPLLTDAEIIQRNADREEATDAATAALSPATPALLDERWDLGGGHGGGWADLAPAREPIKPDLPANRWTVVAALVIVALAAYLSSLFPMGWAT